MQVSDGHERSGENLTVAAWRCAKVGRSTSRRDLRSAVQLDADGFWRCNADIVAEMSKYISVVVYCKRARVITGNKKVLCGPIRRKPQAVATHHRNIMQRRCHRTPRTIILTDKQI